jgi:hypothetical protein
MRFSRRDLFLGLLYPGYLTSDPLSLSSFDGRKVRVFFPFPQPQMIGCPILRVLCEGWDKQNCGVRISGVEP